MTRVIYRQRGRPLSPSDPGYPDVAMAEIPVMESSDWPLRVYNTLPMSKRWPIPKRGQRIVEDLYGNVYKFCDRCHLPKHLSQFSLDATTEDNVYGTCDECVIGRDVYNRLVEQGAIPKQPPHAYNDRFPTVVCLCGSTRFWRTFQETSLAETMAGNIVLSIGAATATDEDHFGHLSVVDYDAAKIMLDELHLRKIDMADEVLILNVGGYIGMSTARELMYAVEHGKVVRFLEPVNGKTRFEPGEYGYDTEDQDG